MASSPAEGALSEGADASALLVFPVASPSDADGDLSPSERRVAQLREHQNFPRVDSRGGFFPGAKGAGVYVDSDDLLEHVSRVDGLGGYLPHTLSPRTASGAGVTPSGVLLQVLLKEREGYLLTTY